MKNKKIKTFLKGVLVAIGILILLIIADLLERDHFFSIIIHPFAEFLEFILSPIVILLSIVIKYLLKLSSWDSSMAALFLTNIFIFPTLCGFLSLLISKILKSKKQNEV